MLSIIAVLLVIVVMVETYVIFELRETRNFWKDEATLRKTIMAEKEVDVTDSEVLKAYYQNN